MFEQIETGPIIAMEVAAASCCDPVLSHVVHTALSGRWRELPSMSEYAPYLARASKLSLAQGCYVGHEGDHCCFIMSALSQ